LASVVCSRAVCRVTEQQLYGSQVANLLVNLSWCCPAHRVPAVCRTIETGALYPSMDDAGKLPRREMRLLPETAREQVSTPAGIEGGQPLAESTPGLPGDLELHRPGGLLLNHGRSIANPPAGERVADPHPNKVGAPELAVDGEIEHCKIALASLHLRPNTNGHDVLWL